MDVEKVEEKKEEEKEEDIIYDGDLNTINLREDLNVNEEEKKLLSHKRGRKKKLKRLPLKLYREKKIKIEPSLFQKLLNSLSKVELLNSDVIKAKAKELNYELEEDHVNFFMEIGKAKAALKKYGLPGAICKNKFHVFIESNFYKTIGTVTDDRLVMNSLYSGAFGVQYKTCQDLFFNSEITSFSIVSNQVYSCKSVFAGYVQDFSKEEAIINIIPLTQTASTQIAELINQKKDVQQFTFTFPNNQSYSFYQYLNLIMVGQENAAALLQKATKIKCVRSKNKFEKGVKEIKTNKDIGTYLNIHDIKPVDFSPSCLFLNPSAPGIKILICADLETNTVYNYLAAKFKEINTFDLLPFPKNCIFWDNIGSFIQMITLIKLIAPGVNEELGKSIASLAEAYTKYKDIINGWKRTYKIFENIVLSFYDHVNNKLTIDSVVKLEGKIAEFLANYTLLKEDGSFPPIRGFFQSLPQALMIKLFISSSIPYELCTAMGRLITVLKLGKRKLDDKKEINVEDMFRSIGYLCSQVLFGGDSEMIPKLRSYAAFLGGPSSGLTNETLQKNIAFLLNSFIKDLKKKEDTEAKKLFISYEDMDRIVNAVIDNSINKSGNKMAQENKETLKKQIKLDETLIKSLREDILEMVKNGDTLEDITLYGDFSENELFVSFLKAFTQLAETMNKIGVEVPNYKLIAESLSVSEKVPRARKKFVKSTAKKKKNINLASAPVTKSILIDNGITKALVIGKNTDQEKVLEALKESVKDVTV